MVLLQTLLDSVLVGGLYGCVAVGLSLSFGVMRIFNWANGEILMSATYLAVFLVNMFGLNPYLCILFVGPLMFLIGFVLQKTALNPLIMRDKEREPLSVLLFTAGIAYILKNLATFLFTTNPISAKTDITSTTWKIGDLIIGRPKAIAFVIALIVVIALEVFLNNTEIGRGLRCASQDREVAQLMGMNIKRLYCLAQAIGFTCIGVAACAMAPMYPAHPGLGATFSFKSMIMVVLGGKGSIKGALVGGLIMGFVEKFVGVWFTDIHAQMMLFAVFVAVLMVKPNGLLSKDRG